ncbi:MAG: DCC1-like thiol-disulfide oxidoreductase family protein [Acidobacteriota bacterium]
MARSGPLRVGAPPTRPLVVFDGDCSFCRFWIARWKRTSGDRLDYAPYQDAAARFPEIPVGEFRRAVGLIRPSGEVLLGAAAVVAARAEVPGRGLWSWVYRRVPGARALMDLAYRFIANHRNAAFRVTRLLWGRNRVS